MKRSKRVAQKMIQEINKHRKSKDLGFKCSLKNLIKLEFT